ncbi:MAG: hypothetical protein B6U95_05460 [Thermofilum sp. ex4484_82]|nr:MAG: hypothetical protein B6U95_05460 [Thermofilum sp. ex4484_82]OYT37961.1 MAG: hypothetical protein B6U96_05455 [Archaeoglobales archaeon ex4484_92]RLE76762.1 MAG: hypothetical protein DRZ80_00435 [Thermoprotei archaeon]
MMIKKGDFVLLYLDEKRKYLVRVDPAKELHTHKGIIRLNKIEGKKYGETVITHLNVSFKILKPLLVDFLENFTRTTQIIYPKDSALMIIMSGIGPGSRVVEAGTGTGALTAVLAYYVRPTGKVYSYDIKKQNIERAKRNLKKIGLEKWVVFKIGDVTQKIDEKEVDAVFLDLPTPWLAVKTAYYSLTNGGVFVSFSPTINQVEKTMEALREHRFVNCKAVELLLRTYKVKMGETRPETFMIGHTGYIVFARKP